MRRRPTGPKITTLAPSRLMSRKGRTRRVACIALIVVLGLLGATQYAAPSSVTAQSSSDLISGQVFQDFNSNGVMNTTLALGTAVDVGVAGIEVRAFDSTGAQVGSTLTASDGTYSLVITEATSPDIRVEFVIPTSLSHLVPSIAPSTSASGSSRGGVVQFAVVGDTGVNLAVNAPGDYCQNNPILVMCGFERGVGADAKAGAFTMPSNMVGFTAFTPTSTQIGASSQLGSIFGIGVDRSRNIFLGTYVKRHVEYGSAGATNTIYRVNLNAPGLVTQFVTLPGALPAHDSTDVGFGPYSGDTGIFTSVGRIGLGDVDVTPDGSTLLAVDMNEADPRLFFIPIEGKGDDVSAGTPRSRSIPAPNTFDGVPCVGKWHPMGIGVRGARILVGGVCGAETTVTSASPNGPHPTQSAAFILEYFGERDGTGSFTTIWADSLGYERGCVYTEGTRIPCNFATSTVGSIATADWSAWNEYPIWRDIDNGTGGLFASNPQAMLSNIEILDTGGLVLGFRDRFQDQIMTGNAAYSLAYDDAFPDPPLPFPKRAGTMSGGDILRLCNTANGLVTESAGTCPSTDLAGGAHLDLTNNLEYFQDAYTEWKNVTTGQPFHAEVFTGSLASQAGFPGGWTTAYDIIALGTQGVYAFGPAAARLGTTFRGSVTGYGSQIGGYDFGNFNGFNKGIGLSDLEILCDMAPFEIGNRVWLDSDGDGIQDPGENPIAGVTVTLSDQQGNVVATTITNSDGEYFFSSSTTPGLEAGQDYVIAFDNPNDYLPNGPLSGVVPTRANTTNTEIGSDAILIDDVNGVYGVTNFPRIPVTSLVSGVSNLSFDAGFVSPVGVGNFVWVDSDSNGIQDVGEPPLQGVIVELLDANAHPVRDAFGNVVAPQITGADGGYFFDGLIPGDYRVRFIAPTGYMTTVAGAGSSENDSDADSATGVTSVFSVPAVAGGDVVVDSDIATVAQFVNMTIDAGFVPYVSVGDFVWLDSDGDGIQDAGEPPLPGVLLSIKNIDGSSVIDVLGSPVTTTATDVNGFYSFDYLPVGQYVVTVSSLVGYVPTKSGVGSTDTDSSTDTATSVLLSTGGQRDATLDFGFVIPTPPVVASPESRDEVAISDVGSPGITVRAVNQFNVTTPGREVWLNPENLSTLPRGARWVESRTRIWDSVKRTWSESVMTPEGVWTVIRGDVRFIPRDDFVGNVSMPFRLEDNKGRTAHAQLNVPVLDQLPATGVSGTPIVLWISGVLICFGHVLRRGSGRGDRQIERSCR